MICSPEVDPPSVMCSLEPKEKDASGTTTMMNCPAPAVSVTFSLDWSRSEAGSSKEAAPEPEAVRFRFDPAGVTVVFGCDA